MREFKTLGIVSGCRYETHTIQSLPIAVNRRRIILCFTFVGASGLFGSSYLAVRRVLALRSFRERLTVLVTDGDLKATDVSSTPPQNVRCR